MTIAAASPICEETFGTKPRSRWDRLPRYCKLFPIDKELEQICAWQDTGSVCGLHVSGRDGSTAVKLDLAEHTPGGYLSRT